VLQSDSQPGLNQPGVPFTIDDRLAIRSAALMSGSSALEINVVMNHPAYFEAVEVFIRGCTSVACVIWRSTDGIQLEDMIGNLNAFAPGLTMSEAFERLAKLARGLTDRADWTYDQPFKLPHRLH
jgi:hypothetical protein